MHAIHRSSRPRGFALVEALVSMLVLASGMLGLAGFGVNLSRNADLAKQRSEATRLAQDKMESLRTFEQLVVGTGKLAYQGLASGSDTPLVMQSARARAMRSSTAAGRSGARRPTTAAWCPSLSAGSTGPAPRNASSSTR